MKKSTALIYEITFAILALIAVAMAIADLMNKIPESLYQEYLILDRTILIIFATDYFYRLFKAPAKIDYFKKNIIDLIAIIPFDSLFRVFRIVRLLRILKLLKTFAFLARLTDKADRFLKTNGFLYVIYFTVSSILLGAILIYLVEKGLTIDSFSDAIWWAFVTTTVGYGDISPSSGIGRIIAGVLMLIGIGFISMLTGTIATFFLTKANKKELNPRQVLDLSNLSEDKYISVVDYAEFVKNRQ